MRNSLAVTLALVAALVAAGCSGPAAKDDDGDLLANQTETNGWTIWVDLFGKRVALHVDSDPAKHDTDGDGVSDLMEFTYPNGLDPRDPDTDKDGLTDCQELLHTVRADCETEGFAGPYDGGYDTIPNNADSEPGGRYWNLYAVYEDETGDAGAIVWGDGISDGDELKTATIMVGGEVRRVVTDPTSADTDGDGLDDGEERYRFETDPTDADSDGDGCTDGLDAVPARAEKYALGLETLRLTNTGALPSAHVEMQFEFQGSRRVPASGTIASRNGESTDLRAYDPAPYTAASCVYNPRDKWLSLSFVVGNTDVGGGALDLFSHVQPGGPTFAAQVYFNPQDGTFAWDAQGAASFAGPLSFAGPDGAIVLAPRVL